MKKMNLFMFFGMACLLLGVSLSTTQVDASVKYTSKVKQESFQRSLRSIGENFNVVFTRPTQQIVQQAGTVEYVVPNGILLRVTNGGPTSLNWSAAVRNNRTGAYVSNWVSFQHGTTQLRIPFNNKNAIRLGDSLSVVFTNNNFPQSTSQIYGFIGEF
ncbi:TPA: hypothetical protein ACN1M8_002218 [Enterococcus faecium]